MGRFFCYGMKRNSKLQTCPLVILYSISANSTRGPPNSIGAMGSVDRVITLGGVGGGGRKPETGIIYNDKIWRKRFTKSLGNVLFETCLFFRIFSTEFLQAILQWRYFIRREWLQAHVYFGDRITRIGWLTLITLQTPFNIWWVHYYKSSGTAGLSLFLFK